MKLNTSKKEYLKFKEVARAIIQEKVIYFSNLYNVAPKKIAIRNTRSRWGSCSQKGNLNFSYKVAFLSKEESNYVVVHEICHLLQFNHSKNFWKLVEKTIPKYKTIRKSLSTGSKLR